MESKNDPNYQFEDFIENGIVNYRFKISEGSYSYYYVIRPQYELGPGNGVRFNTRSDFYISHSAVEKDGIAITDEAIISSVKKIAIYLDGYTYHATEENCRFFDDLKKRMAIVESGDIISWTLTWSDIERFDAKEAQNNHSSKVDALCIDAVKYRQTIEIYKKIPYTEAYRSNLTECKNSFERLLWILTHPLLENKTLEKTVLMLSLRQIKFGIPSVDQADIDLVLNDPSIKVDESLIAKDKAKGNFYILPELPTTSEFANIKLVIKVADLEMRSTISTLPAIKTLDKGQWEAFWQVYNLIQITTVLLWSFKEEVKD